MFKYLMAFLALVAVAFAVPNPEAKADPAPNPKPQFVYSAPYAYSAGVPLAYSAPAVIAGVPAAYTYY
ncbi:hypothetical protein ABEB36_001280 [Hypothenemus hampei]|uniref:Neuropeptide-like 4 n=1 Tax=Hypothenemus hampei TaxID=57062 RepID=A0ABD1FE37_HYPHA